MGRKRADNLGISSDNETARTARGSALKHLSEDREVEGFFRSRGFHYFMSLGRFPSLWQQHYQPHDNEIVVVDQRKRQHSFPREERDRAWDYCQRIMIFLYAKPPPSQRARVRRGHPPR